MSNFFTIQHLIPGIVLEELVVLSISFCLDDCHHPYNVSLLTLYQFKKNAKQQ